LARGFSWDITPSPFGSFWLSRVIPDEMNKIKTIIVNNVFF